MYPEQYISDAFTYILNMSVTGSYIILAVLVARLLLKKAPKKISCLLWIAPFVRLCIPFAPRSVFSLFNLGIFNKDVYSGTVHEYVPFSYDWDYTPEFSTGITQNQSIIPSTFEAFTGTPEYSANPLQIILFVLAAVWLLGIFVILTYAAVTLIKTKKKLRTATKLEGNIFESENIFSPFVMGIIRPKIYLPYGLSDKEREYIILHEKTHIKNLDHFSKILAFLVLTLHWFNPLCYVAFSLMSRDMEMACDESVLKQNEDIRKDYSASLLSFASGKKLPSPSPLCFGESGIKQRIKNAIAWKKPKIWVVTAGLVVLFICTVAFISNPSGSTVVSGKLDGALDKAVSDMILEQLDEKYQPYFCKTEAHEIFGYAENENEITVYGYMSCSTMNFMNGYLSSYAGSGFAHSFSATFTKNNGTYSLKELRTPQDGMGHGDSIREIFPAEFEKKALYPKSYKDKLQKQKLAQAKAALEYAGFDCEVVAASDIDVVLMGNHDAQEKMDSTELFSTAYYPMFVGVVMYEQNGVYTVYERRADNDKGRYYFAAYENGSTEALAHAFDKNGNYLGQEKIPVKSFFDYEVPGNDTELYYVFDESKMTTKAYIAG